MGIVALQPGEEDLHRVLKSGCTIEALAHKTRTRLGRAIAIRLVIGWRIMLMTLLGRTCPELPAEVLFSDIEIEVLAAYAKKNDWPYPGLWVLPSDLSLDWAATSAAAKTPRLATKSSGADRRS